MNDPPVCTVCHDEYSIDPGLDDDGLCHECAHSEVERLRAALESQWQEANATIEEVSQESDHHRETLCEVLRRLRWPSATGQERCGMALGVVGDMVPELFEECDNDK